MFWTEQRAAELVALWPTSLTAGEIAARLGTTRNAVIGKANRMGLVRRRVGRKAP